MDLLTSATVPEDSLPSVLAKLKGKTSDEEKKLRVDEDDIVNDAMAYYKQFDFDQKVTLRIIFNGEPAADSGGLLRHFFACVLKKHVESYFVGDRMKVPLYNSDVLIFGIMKIIGTVVSHSVIQGGPGLPVFSEAVYWYVATGDVNEAMKRLSVDDCGNPEYRIAIRMVCIDYCYQFCIIFQAS